MPATTSDFLQKIKTRCDNDTFLFTFKGEEEAIAIARSILYKPWKVIVNPMTKYDDIEDSQYESGIYYGFDANERVISPVTGEEVPNEKYLKVYKRTKSIDRDTDNVLISDWEETKYTAVKESEVLTSGVIEEYYSFEDPSSTYYSRVIMPRQLRNSAYNIFYKNNNGVWINYDKYINSNYSKASGSNYANVIIQQAAVLYEEALKLTDITAIPRCKFIDSDHYIYYIDAEDGGDEEDEVLISKELDTNDVSKVQYEAINVDDKGLPFNARHVMTDLKVTLPENERKNNYLFWLNGTIIPTVQDNSLENVFYVENAMTIIDSKVVNQIAKAGHDSTSNATVIEDPNNDELRLDVNLRAFGWNGVRMSEHYKPVGTVTIPISYNYKAVNMMNELTFAEPINKNAHMILCNGKILAPTEYEIKPDGKSIKLLKAEKEAYSLLYEIERDIKENSSIYGGLNPLTLISKTLTSKTYSLINFESTDSGKTLYLKTSRACATNFPLQNQVTFSNINIGDLVTVDGLYVPFLWIHAKTIEYPKCKWTYAADGVDNLSEKEILRWFFTYKK